MKHCFYPSYSIEEPARHSTGIVVFDAKFLQHTDEIAAKTKFIGLILFEWISVVRRVFQLQFSGSSAIVAKQRQIHLTVCSGSSRRPCNDDDVVL